ncbi:hypothetical protein [Desertimonas flava]|uniref:hypothetical protein n=1 Tax=Desertimonas flava TaxID=2064846 RepID=UPI0013C43876|nr:hypothetical protein [Desertimonas flava]
MTTAVIVVAIAVTIAVVAWFLLNRQHPETAAGHDEPDRHGSAQFFGDVNDRPGDPGAEADGVAGPGQPAPGASASAVDSPQGTDRAGGPVDRR